MKLLAALILAMLMAAPSHAQRVSFGLFGDTPYNAWERRHLPELIAEMDGEDLAFVIHDGDIKSGSSECSDTAFLDVLGAFRQSMHPLIYVPGDNEWTDCHRRSNGAYDPLERLAKLRELFFADAHALGRRKLVLERQSNDPAFAAYRENVRWEAGGVLFVGLNLPGSANNFHGAKGGGPSADYLARGKANHAWLAQAFALARDRRLAGLLLVIQANPGFHAANAGRPATGFADFLDQLRRETMRFAGQVVLVHGDTHQHRIDQPMEDPESGAPIKNFTRVETFGSPSFGWIKASVDPANPRLFRFEPRIFAKPVFQ
ncbi:MAG: hypothetical protein KA806_03745 [Sulfuritalea sp.]|nr:hypothetical protein [Sulfuritalea sp.]MBP7422518.1 hypothetical protein [Sulfuritalea sp.]